MDTANAHNDTIDETEDLLEQEAAGDEIVQVTEIQAPGKRMMSTSDFLNGCALTAGARFTS